MLETFCETRPPPAAAWAVVWSGPAPAGHRRQFPGRGHTTPATPRAAIASAGRDTSPRELAEPAGHFPERRCPQSGARFARARVPRGAAAQDRPPHPLWIAFLGP